MRSDPRRLILLEDGHCLRDQALALCGTAGSETLKELAAASLTTVMQMVANGYGVTPRRKETNQRHLRGAPAQAVDDATIVMQSRGL